MEKDQDLERDLEKAEKGVVVTIINQTAKPLTHDASKHPHGKFKARPPKIIAAKVCRISFVSLPFVKYVMG